MDERTQDASSHESSILERLISITSELSGHPRDSLVATSTFTELGFDSLFLTELAANYQEKFGVKLTFRQLFEEFPTPLALARHLAIQVPPLPDAPGPERSVEETRPAEAPRVPASRPAGDTLDAEQKETVQSRFEAVASNAGTHRTSGDTTGLRRIILRQLELMNLQLAELSRANATGAPSAPAATGTAQASPPEAATRRVETPAATDDAASAAITQRHVLAPRQAAHLARLAARWHGRTAESRRMASKGNQAPPPYASFSDLASFEQATDYPLRLRSFDGARVEDIDGNRFVDLVNDLGRRPFGHRPAFLRAAMTDLLGRDDHAPVTVAASAAQALRELTGGEDVVWLRCGEAALAAATRAARRLTGRDRVAVAAGSAAAHAFAACDILLLDPDEAAALRQLRAHAHQLAAVVVDRRTAAGKVGATWRDTLASWRTVTRECGIGLIVDLVTTPLPPCRSALEPATTCEADVLVLGEALSGGVACGAMVGKADWVAAARVDDNLDLQLVDDLGMVAAACAASLRLPNSEDPALFERVAQRAEALAEDLNRFFERQGVAMRLEREEWSLRLDSSDALAASLLAHHLRCRDVLAYAGRAWSLTAAHTNEDVDIVSAAVKDSICEMQADGFLPPAPAGAETWRRAMPLTEGQKELWIASQGGPQASCAFNESDIFRISGPLDVERLETALVTVLERHEAFRLRFDADGGTQVIDEQAKATIDRVDFSALPPAQRATALEELVSRAAGTPFDLENGPLYRCCLAKLGPSDHVLLMYFHHLVFDGYTGHLIIEEVASAYEAAGTGAAPPPPVSVPFSHYLYCKLGRQTGSQASEDLDYWRGVFAMPPEPLDLPLDGARGAMRAYEANTAHRELEPDLLRSLQALGRSQGCTMFSLLLAGFECLLARLSGQSDIVVGIPAAGQAHLGIPAVGYCVNALPIRGRPEPDKPFSAFLRETRTAVLDAMEHQEVGIGQLTRKLRLPRVPNRLAVTEVFFNYSGYLSNVRLGECRVVAHENPRRAIFYDMFLHVVESAGHLILDWDYNTALFEEETIRRWLNHYVEILRGVVANADEEIGDLPLLSTEDTEAVIAAWTGNRT